MSTYRALAMADRVVLIHDMPDRTVISELDVEQADQLLEQLAAAVKQSIETLSRIGGALAADRTALAGGVAP